MIQIVTVTDYDDYFTSLVKANLNIVLNPNIRTIYITAGPYRTYGSAFEWISDSEVHLDFYSATRNGFGWIDLDSLLVSLNTSEYIQVDSEHIGGHQKLMEYIKLK